MYNKIIFIIIVIVFSIAIFSCKTGKEEPYKNNLKRPNILIAISDDQSFPHTSFAGSEFVKTPGFDRIASSGIYFTNCMAGSPGCAPSRSALVTGRHHWQNEQSGQHAAGWFKKFVPFVDVLEESGYHVGSTAKGVSPFRYSRNEDDSLLRSEDAAGKKFNKYRYEPGTPGDIRPANEINTLNYYANFEDFMSQRQEDTPFYFWYGSTEPHRAFEKDSWKRTDKKLADAEVPGFLPDNEIIKGDLLDYAVEIEWFDRHLVKMINYLDSIGELDNTIVIVTSDNGMAFPRAKANAYEYGIHVPLAISFPAEVPGNRVVEDPVGFIDIAPTLLEMTGTSTEGMLPITGKSISEILKSDKSGVVNPDRKYVFSGRERHSSSRWQNLGYPQRAIRSKDYLFIWNIKPERYPAGAPQTFSDETKTLLNPLYGINAEGEHISNHAFTDIDACPAKSFIVENHEDPDVQKYFELAVGLRPEFELFNIKTDPYCLTNLAGNENYAEVEAEMKAALLQELEETGDPRVVGPDKEVFDSYPRYSPMRYFPEPYWVGGE
ncbi:MAG: sulfatase family protein [Bacteroidales bacterium]